MILTRFALGLLAAALAGGQTLDKLELHNVHGNSVTYRQRPAIHLTPSGNGERNLAIVQGSSFQDGTIEADVAGAPAPGVSEAARGFIGIAFRVQPEGAKLELFYIRPTNGRADDQLRRNHSTQYESFPDWPWNRLRQEAPGVYESYTDLETGAWTRIKIAVAGAKAKLYVGGALQPCLIVNDLKLAPAKGAVALWVGPGTDGYFSNLRVVLQ
jgi:hypothetical protein